MTFSYYCLNPSCPQPKNPPKTKVCNACGTKILLKNRYLALKKIGKGGFGATFLAVDLSKEGKQYCVIKQLRPSTEEPDVFQMAKDLFEREANTLKKIDHPQVPKLLDYFEDNQQFYLVQQLIKGLNLQQEVKKKGPFSELKAKQFLVEILPVIRDIHDQKVIHRDIKPANIIRHQKNNQLVLIDFGAVKDRVNTLVAKTYGQTALTEFAVGTVGFAPPEQLAMRPVFSSDIYALGATCLYLLTAKSPKDLGVDNTTGEIAWQKHIQLSEKFSTVLSTMLEVSVRNRFKTAQEVIDALEMAPYEDVLAEGMLTQPFAQVNPSSTNLSPGLNRYQPPSSAPNTTGISATEQIMKNIQARRSRTRNPRLNTGIKRNQNPSNKNNIQNLNTPKKPIKKVFPKLTEETVLNEYSQGKTNFSSKNLNQLKLVKADLSECYFSQSQLIKINLQRANLSKANFDGANLTQANLKKANLSESYLGSVDLQGADLRGANLQNAELKNANLKGANLCGANLLNANVTEAQLAQTKTNWGTVRPNGRRKLW